MMAAKTIMPVLAQMQPRNSLNLSFQLIFAADNQPVNAPAFVVPPGASVTLRSINGSAINAQGCSISDHYEGVGRSGALFLPPGADVSVPWPVDNTNQIWVSGKAGDGLLISVQASQVG